MKAEPQKEHAWLQQLVGEWTTEMEAQMGPDKPMETFTGYETVRAIGGLWTMGEGGGDMPDGTPVVNIMTLGYDPARQRFVGTFISSMMTYLWTYEGTLDAAGKVLTLDAEGPAMDPSGGMKKYQDIITIISADHRVMTSQMLGDDGKFHQFMSMHYRRKK